MTEEIISTEDIMATTMYIMTLSESKFKDKVHKYISTLLEENQTNILTRAITDGHTDEKELGELRQKYQVDDNILAEVFKHIYEMGVEIKTRNKDKKIVMVTSDEKTGMYKMKDYMLERFNVDVLTAVEALEMMNKNDKDMTKSQIEDYIG